METTGSDPSRLDLNMRIQSANIASQLIAISMAPMACDMHEFCDGSCSAEGPTTIFQPLRVGELDFQASIKDPERSNLPLVQENPVQVPVEEFNYTPIDSKSGEIRVFRIQETEFRADPIVASMFTVNLNSTDRPKYSALSYNWGEAKFDHIIICDGKVLKVNASLHECLKRHRQDRFEKPPLFWADAICINQKDKHEVNSQIPLMGAIYQLAETVFVDLGDVPLYWYMAYDLMHRYRVIRQVNQDQALARTNNFNQIYGLPPFEHDAWKAFLQLFSSPWFNRTWTIQEMVLARNIRVRFGRFNFDWTEIVHTTELIQLQRGPITAMISFEGQVGMLNFNRILRIRIDFKSGRLTPLQLLWRTRDCQVSNPRDKVVALLGMLTNQRSAFLLDYTWPTDKLFYHFDAYVLKYFPFSERAAMLSYAGLQFREIEGSKLPSWAPDWLAHSGTGPVVFSTLREKPFNAAKGTLPVMYALGDFEKGGSFITQTSICLGKITHLSGDTDRESKGESPGQDSIQLEAKTHEELLGKVLSGAEAAWLRWYKDSLQVLNSAIADNKLRYDDPNEALSVTLLGGDQYIGDCATHNSVPILEPQNALTEMVAKINLGEAFESVGLSAVDLYRTQTAVACRKRRFAITDEGYIGLVPLCSEVGDGVYILGGVSVPFVMRRKGSKEFVLVGDAYIHGVMEGEAAEKVEFPDQWEPVFIF
ncbi:hypothetical protein EG329_012876 [Mollisiaceae sp. DMI_Dod_QoI]|nr:hypothetical protein EG329_012876 [Helotiales sp. DMI_Dod_QoI]